MHTSETDIYLRLRNGAFDVRKTLSRGQWGASQDDVRTHLPQLERVGAARRPRADAVLRAQRRTSCARAAATSRCAARRTKSTRCGRRGRPPASTAAIRPACFDLMDGSPRTRRSASPTVYRGDRLPAELRGNVFVVDPAANVVSRIIIQDDGTKLVGAKGLRPAEFLTSTDERFRPVYLSNAPDGGCISSTCTTASSSIATTSPSTFAIRSSRGKLEGPIGHGRIYRIVHDSTRTARAKPPRADR